MTFKQLEQFLKTEKWRAGTERGADMCGKYARCAYCDRFSDYPCARAYDTLMRRKKEGKAVISSWSFPEPDVKERFGTTYALEDSVGGVARISIDPEDLFLFSMGGRNMEMYAQPYYTKDAGDAEVGSYAETALSLPSGAEELRSEAGRKRFRVGYLVPVNARRGDETRVLVIRKRSKS